MGLANLFVGEQSPLAANQFVEPCRFDELVVDPNRFHQADVADTFDVHVESIFLGSSEPTAARTDRGRACPGPS